MLTDLLKSPANRLFDKGVAHSTTAAGMCTRLEGRRLQLLPTASAMAVYFTVTQGQLRMEAGISDDADATLAGTPLSLARLSGSDPEAVIREGAVTVSGDTEIADQFRYLLGLVRPDGEELLSRFTGDAVAHEAGRAARGAMDWARYAGRSLGRSRAESLSEETEALATQVEVDEFCAAVDEVSAAADRLEAGVWQLRNSADPR